MRAVGTLSLWCPVRPDAGSIDPWVAAAADLAARRVWLGFSGEPGPVDVEGARALESVGSPGRVELGLTVLGPMWAPGRCIEAVRRVGARAGGRRSALAVGVGDEELRRQRGWVGPVADELTAHLQATIAGLEQSEPVEVGVAARRPGLAAVAGREGAAFCLTWLVGPVELATRLLPALKEGAGERSRPVPSLIAAVPFLGPVGPERARTRARRRWAAHLRSEVYRDLRSPGSDLLDVALYGGVDRVAEGLAVLLAAGADEIAVGLYPREGALSRQDQEIVAGAAELAGLTAGLR